jgi:hypothetical protein
MQLALQKSHASILVQTGNCMWICTWYHWPVGISIYSTESLLHVTGQAKWLDLTCKDVEASLLISILVTLEALVAIIPDNFSVDTLSTAISTCTKNNSMFLYLSGLTSLYHFWFVSLTTSLCPNQLLSWHTTDNDNCWLRFGILLQHCSHVKYKDKYCQSLTLPFFDRNADRNMQTYEWYSTSETKKPIHSHIM